MLNNFDKIISKRLFLGIYITQSVELKSTTKPKSMKKQHYIYTLKACVSVQSEDFWEQVNVLI
jgi:hypothetical protein